MGFELTVVSNTPLTPLKDIDDVATAFLNQIGYLPKGYDPKTGAKSLQDSVPYRLFVECLMTRAERGWTAEQLAVKLKTTKATVYRHLNKLKEVDLLDEVPVDDRGTKRKGPDSLREPREGVELRRGERRARDGRVPEDRRAPPEARRPAEEVTCPRKRSSP